jgi:hypothetical protein
MTVGCSNGLSVATGVIRLDVEWLEQQWMTQAHTQAHTLRVLLAGTKRRRRMHQRLWRKVRAR